MPLQKLMKSYRAKLGIDLTVAPLRMNNIFLGMAVGELVAERLKIKCLLGYHISQEPLTKMKRKD